MAVPMEADLACLNKRKKPFLEHFWTQKMLKKQQTNSQLALQQYKLLL